MKRSDKETWRRSIRLAGYDYSQAGAYFVTICARNRLCIFGEIEAAIMRLNRLGHIVERTWAELPEHYLHVELDLFVVMPNHVHGVILLADDEPPRAMTGAVHAAGPGLSAEAVLGVQGVVGAGLKPAPTRPRRHAVPEIVRAFKTFSSRKINQCRGTVGARVWQRGYYERVIRRETELSRIRDYIQDNPHGWNTDVENPFAEGALPDVRRWDG